MSGRRSGGLQVITNEGKKVKKVPTAEIPEDQLVKAALEGDSDAAELLVDRYWERVFAYAYRLTLNRADAEDIAQEAFFRVFRGLEQYVPEGQFKAWLLRITTNIFLDQKKSPRSQEVVSTTLASSTLNTGSQPGDEMMRQELVQAVWKTMATLNKEQQAVMVLRGLESMDYAQIGDILGIKEGTARWHMYEGRRIICQKLSKRFDLEGLADE